MTDPLEAAILAATEAVDAARSELGRLDGAAGDGDHGMSMSIGARNVRRRLAALPQDRTTADLLDEVGLAMSDVGGAIGPLYSTALSAMAATLRSSDVATTDALGITRRAAEAAEDAVSAIGHAKPGDKTVIDALHPLVESLRRNEAGATDLRTAIPAAADAAEAGAASTADLVARVGRASRLGERSRGEPDAGATSLAIVVRAMADAYLRGPSGDG